MIREEAYWFFPSEQFQNIYFVQQTVMVTSFLLPMTSLFYTVFKSSETLNVA